MDELTYSEMPDALGMKFFRCDRLRSTLSTVGCGKNFSRAQNLRPDQITSVHLCRRCPLGARHAGVQLIELSRLHGIDRCPRCHQYAGRIINGTRCVSCYNREAEQVRGRNGKGTVPTMAPLQPRRLTVIVNGAPTEVRSERTARAAEIALAVLRAVPGHVTFSRARGGAAVALADFLAPHRSGRPPAGAAKRRAG